ncbi:hypothetical protein yc1106_07525 [Curvularia clavata]|uniref:Pentatricopeptide repeat-containing protein n=1 Tax=Curvularia clavata TaxID=95742 RepID=A0A9Q8ZDQ0_CURCL|nr:hypothetical protein yc1106_07525 [Curvularia clavata]
MPPNQIKKKQRLWFNNSDRICENQHKMGKIYHPQKKADRRHGAVEESTYYTAYEQEGAQQEAEPVEAPDEHLVYAAPILQALDAKNIQKAWDSFEQVYTARDCKALTVPNFPGELSKQELVFNQLLGAVTRAFCSNKKNVRVTPTAALFRYQQLGIARPGYWYNSGIGRLTHEVILAVNMPSHRPQQDLQVLLHEVISLWRLFFQCMGPKSDMLNSISDDWSLPSLEELPGMHDSRDFNRRLQNYLPKYSIKPPFGFCALYLYSISDALEPTARQTAAPFISFLERLLAGSRVDTIFLHTESSLQLKTLPDNVRRQIRNEVEIAPKKAMAAIGKIGESPDEMTNLEAFHIKRIERAAETLTSLKKLDEIWKEVQIAYRIDDGSIAVPRSVYNNFLSGYLILRNSQRAVEVWNHMVAHNVKPDMQSWVALLEGCAKAKDLRGFNAMWQRMLNTGLEPDNYAWTTRVNGLMSLRQVNSGLAALDEMGKRWLAAEEAAQNSKKHGKGQKGANQNSGKAVNEITKPSIEVINGAISGIVRIHANSMRHEKRVELIQKILGWATNFQIKPDAITYNSLIQLYLLGNDIGTAFRLLSQMEKEGIEGDIATHTMLIKAAFENHVLDGQTEQQQTESVLKMFDNLEASGLKLNDYVYALSIDRLLKNYANSSAVRTIMEHMTSRGFVPSSHVYTSLITHYFQCEPPNVGEVDHIVNLLFTAPRMPSDAILYDRIIEGYASLGEVGKMMSVLTRMSKQGKMPGWGALIAVVRELARQGDVERARDVVRDVARGEGVAKQGILGNREGENVFLHLVRVLGLGEGDVWTRDAGTSGSVVQRHVMAEEGNLDSVQHQRQQ